MWRTLVNELVNTNQHPTEKQTNMNMDDCLLKTGSVVKLYIYNTLVEIHVSKHMHMYILQPNLCIDT